MKTTHRLIVEKVQMSYTELPDTVETVLVCDGELSVIKLVFNALSSSEYRLRLVEITKTETHQTIEFKRARQDSPFVT